MEVGRTVGPLMKMFNLINIGERAGSGVPNIFNVWEDEEWEEPEIIEEFDPDRTVLVLSFIKKVAKKSFRNALVRANYNDLKAGIHETTEFLELFLRNFLLNETNPLHNRSMHISGIFDDFRKQDIEMLKQDIGAQSEDAKAVKQDIHSEKQDIETPTQNIAIIDLYDSELQKAAFSKKTLEHIQKLYDKFGNDRVFGRAEVMSALGITASPASELIRKLLGIEIITPVRGKGKGKYVFR